MIRKCNKYTKEARIKARQIETINIPYLLDNILIVNKLILDRSIGELIRVVDTKEEEL